MSSIWTSNSSGFLFRLKSFMKIVPVSPCGSQKCSLLSSPQKNCSDMRTERLLRSCNDLLWPAGVSVAVGLKPWSSQGLREQTPEPLLVVQHQRTPGTLWCWISQSPESCRTNPDLKQTSFSSMSMWQSKRDFSFHLGFYYYCFIVLLRLLVHVSVKNNRSNRIWSVVFYLTFI